MFVYQNKFCHFFLEIDDAVEETFSNGMISFQGENFISSQTPSGSFHLLSCFQLDKTYLYQLVVDA